MKYLLVYEARDQSPPTPEKMAAISKFAQEMSAAGVLVMTGGLQRASRSTRVRMAAGNFTATDGPFAETKEVIDGFALVNAKSKEEAVEIARRFMTVAGDGEGEVLQVFEPPRGYPE